MYSNLSAICRCCGRRTDISGDGVSSDLIVKCSHCRERLGAWGDLAEIADQDAIVAKDNMAALVRTSPREGLMSLRRSEAEPTLHPRVGVVFCMLDAGDGLVSCAVTRSALEERASIEGDDWTDPVAVFLRYRDQIEQAAREKFATLHTRQTHTVFVFAKDLNPGHRPVAGRPMMTPGTAVPAPL